MKSREEIQKRIVEVTNLYKMPPEDFSVKEIAEIDCELKVLSWVLGVWFEVYTTSEDGTETIMSFDTEEEAKDYIQCNPDLKLDYDKWTFNSKTGQNEKLG